METILVALGLILILEGLPYFAFPTLFKTWIARILTLPESVLRVYGLAAMIIGLLLIYLARRVLL
ncbi:MAG: DUF2065 domain-containing protein [Thermodesulfobacteriota bacterium]